MDPGHFLRRNYSSLPWTQARRASSFPSGVTVRHAGKEGHVLSRSTSVPCDTLLELGGLVLTLSGKWTPLEELYYV